MKGRELLHTVSVRSGSSGVGVLMRADPELRSQSFSLLLITAQRETPAGLTGATASVQGHGAGGSDESRGRKKTDRGS